MRQWRTTTTIICEVPFDHDFHRFAVYNAVNDQFLGWVDILPGLKSGASTSLTSLRPLGIEPNGRRSRCIPPLKRRVFANGLP